jgi:hypothetical protein
MVFKGNILCARILDYYNIGFYDTLYINALLNCFLLNFYIIIV